MYYKELILQALEEKNWDEIISLATQAKNIQLGEVFLGIRKGYVNLFNGYDNLLYEMFTKLGVKCFWTKTQPGLNKLIKDGDLSLQLIMNEPVIIFSGKATVNDKLMRLKWPVCLFSSKVKSKKTKEKTKNGYTIYEYTYVITNHMTNEEISFNKDNSENVLTGLMRDSRINSILDDL
jgi:hypothetical protein